MQKQLWEPEHDPAIEAEICSAIEEERIEAAAFQQRMHDIFLIVRNAALILDWNIDRSFREAA